MMPISGPTLWERVERDLQTAQLSGLERVLKSGCNLGLDNFDGRADIAVSELSENHPKNRVRLKPSGQVSLANRCT